MLFTCWGKVRGGCDQVHDTTEEAAVCQGLDQEGCKAQGGYSDRHTRIIQSEEELKSYDVTKGPGKKLS